MDKQCFLPTESILLKPQNNNNRINFLDSQIFFKEILPINNIPKKKRR